MIRFSVPLGLAWSVLMLLPCFGSPGASAATTRDEDVAVVKGKVSFNENRLESWDGQKLQVPLHEIETKLFERVKLPQAPIPKDWDTLKPEERQQWIKEFEESEAGKKFVAERKKLIEEAHAFDVKIEKDGDFVVYDVPPAVYGLQGAVDKKIGDTTYRFEIFGQIEVLKDVDEIALAPLQIDVTPLLETGEQAPPIEVTNYNEKTKLTIDRFKKRYLFVNFWITDSPSATYQNGVQKMYTALKGKYPLGLLSICVDDDRDQALKYILEKRLKEGSHGFTMGMDHRTVFDYGVRAIPSFWLIAPDGTIAMTQNDFARSFHVNQDLSVIVANRIEGKDLPSPVDENESAKKN